MEDVKQKIIDRLMVKLAEARARLKDRKTSMISTWEDCLLRRPGKHRIAACNYPHHINCPDLDGNIPNKCPVRHGAIVIDIGDEERK